MAEQRKSVLGQGEGGGGQGRIVQRRGGQTEPGKEWVGERLLKRLPACFCNWI